MWKKILFWTLAVMITLGASVYQRMTGPTHPQYLKTNINGVDYSFKFIRSGGETDCPILLKGFGGFDKGIAVTDKSTGQSEATATIYWRKYPSEDAFSKIEMQPAAEGLSASLPVQPAAGKLEYYVAIGTKTEGSGGIVTTDHYYFKDEPLMIRFKGDVPMWVLIPHIICMFVSMLFAAYAFLCALANMPQYKKNITIAFWIIMVGGFILGPLVQKYAFDIYWSGFPFGGDLTDNKTLFAAIALLAAVITKKFQWNRWVAVAAVLVMFAVFSIPHSMRGSELDHTTGKVGTAQVDVNK
ncbi:MAG: hypothetical protein RR555_09150 [Bacteroidales bacterium]